MEVPQIVALSIPGFFLLIGVEVLINYLQEKDYYKLNDALTSISCGIGSELFGIFSKTALFFGYLYIYENLKIYDMPDTIWSWVILFFGVDFFYYWFHRKSHEVNFIWAAHIVHHQSEEYNLSTALRQAWFQSSFSWVFYLPLAFVGFSPYAFLVVKGINLVYQFWIHTKLIGKMGFLELFMNTPSHHRVHHGKNPKYLDKNYAAVFIIWDRMFGTYMKEEEEPVFGITNTYKSWNPVWTNFHYWGELWEISKNSTRLVDKIKVFLKPPGWRPAELGGFKGAPEVDKETYEKYDVAVSNSLAAYSFIQFIPALGLAAVFLFLEKEFSAVQQMAITSLVIFSLLSSGAIFEKAKWITIGEYVRLLAIPCAALLFMETAGFSTIILVAGSWALLSLVWFSSQLKGFQTAK